MLVSTHTHYSNTDPYDNDTTEARSRFRQVQKKNTGDRGGTTRRSQDGTQTEEAVQRLGASSKQIQAAIGGEQRAEVTETRPMSETMLLCVSIFTFDHKEGREPSRSTTMKVEGDRAVSEETDDASGRKRPDDKMATVWCR
ncbi:hypothetical protein HN51_047674 [Arachis hypogaea]